MTHPLKAFLNEKSKEWKEERAEQQMTLGELIDELSDIDPQTPVEGFYEPASYRGFYSDLAFVADRAGAKVERNPYRLGPPPNDKQSGEIDIIVGDWTSGYHAAVSWGPANWTDVDTEREAVVAAIDAILDHEQEERAPP